jgi:AcrR family transcriptional regulator
VPDAEARARLEREAIVEAARQMIVADGLDALSLRRLAARLGVTAPALYAHVADKQDLLRAVADREFDALVARFVAVEAAGPIERIRAHGRAYVAHARAHPELFATMFLFPPRIEPLDAPAAELPGATRAFAAAAIDAGLLHAEDPLLVALALWAGAHGVAQVLQLGFALPDGFAEALADEVTDGLLAGYGVPRSGHEG